MPRVTREDQRWRAVCARDEAADDAFVFAVKTTGVFCRPSCGARRPLRKNVRFFDSTSDARAAGFRACKRCKPLEPSRSRQRAALVERLCRALEQEPAPTLAELSALAGTSPFHLQRVFKAATGVSPRQYALAKRAERVKAALRRGGTVTEALYEAGYGSSSRFYERATAMLGTTPRRFQTGALTGPVRFATAACSLGRLLVATTERGVCAVSLGDADDALIEELRARFPRADLERDANGLTDLVRDVVATVDAPTRAVPLPLDVRGTAFQHRVWQALLAIPPGETRSYAQLARAIGAPTSTRAVAQACGANPVAVLVPCHRVVREGGALSGYRWGVERKAALLRRELGSPDLCVRGT